MTPVLETWHRLKRAFGYTPRTIRCTTCGRPKVGNPFVAGPGVYVCDACVREVTALANASQSTLGAPAECRFCGKTTLVTRFGKEQEVDVCSRCIQLMNEILRENATGS